MRPRSRNWRKNQNLDFKEIELSYCRHSICLQKTSILIIKKPSKLDEKMTELCPINVLAQKWHLTYFVPIDGHFGHMF